MQPFITQAMPLTDALLNVIAHLPTKSLSATVESGFFRKLEDKDFMRIAVLLAQKSYDEGGCPVGVVVIDNEKRWILGKGHNTPVQENHPYNHGEPRLFVTPGGKTSAVRRFSQR
jgi:cytosine/creatinine deaminase